MDSRTILERIISEKGSCTWVREYYHIDLNYICSRCPISKLAKKQNGDWINCVEALGFNAAVNDETYMRKAEELLLDLMIDDMLRDG